MQPNTNLPSLPLLAFIVPTVQPTLTSPAPFLCLHTSHTYNSLPFSLSTWHLNLDIGCKADCKHDFAHSRGHRAQGIYTTRQLESGRGKRRATQPRHTREILLKGADLDIFEGRPSRPPVVASCNEQLLNSSSGIRRISPRRHCGDELLYLVLFFHCCLIQPLPDSEISGAISFEFQSRPFFPDLAKHQISTSSDSDSLQTWHSLTSHLEPLSPAAHNTLLPLPGTLRNLVFLVH